MRPVKFRCHGRRVRGFRPAEGVGEAIQYLWFFPLGVGDGQFGRDRGTTTQSVKVFIVQSARQTVSLWKNTEGCNLPVEEYGIHEKQDCTCLWTFPRFRLSPCAYLNLPLYNLHITSAEGLKRDYCNYAVVFGDVVLRRPFIRLPMSCTYMTQKIKFLHPAP